MDKETARLLLASYRPQEAEDSTFAEALRLAETDPELSAWLAEMQQFDAVMASKFQDVLVPADLKSHILLGYHAPAATVEAAPARPRAWLIAGSLAALLAVSLLSWRLFAPAGGKSAALAQQAISFTEQMPPLQFVCFDAKAVAQWINQQPGSQKVGLQLPQPPDSLSMAMIGSSVVDWNGRPVVMVCLQNGRQMAMLYVLKASDAADLPEGSTETIQEAGWAVRTTRANGQVRLLTTKGRAENLDFQMPF